MFKNEIKEYLQNLNNAVKEMDKNFLELKINLNNLEKIGKNTIQEYKALDDLGIELYQNKMRINDLIKTMM